MRLHLTLICSPRSVVPFNYGYLVSSAIYHIIERSDAGFSQQLHAAGYPAANKRFKLFCFSRLEFPFDRPADRPGFLAVLGTRATLQVSFLMPEALERFVAGLFREQDFHLWNRDFDTRFRVETVQVLPPPGFVNTMRYRLHTPLCLKRQRADDGVDFLSPDQPGYADLLIQNLRNKLAAAGRSVPEGPALFRHTTEPKSKLLRVKNTEIRGYLFDFELTAPVALHEAAWDAGFGLEGSQGFGWGEVLQQNFKSSKNE